MNKTLFGQPIWVWLAAAGVFGGALYIIKKKQSSGGATTGKTAAPAYSQQQETTDFQIFSQLTSAQQGADLSLVGQLASIFGGGSSKGATTGTTTTPGGGASGGGGGGTTGSTPGGTATAPTGPTVKSTAPTSGSGPQLNTKTIGGQQYYGLGAVGPNGTYTGYNVSNGAPVYETINGVPTQGFTTKNLTPGETLYTPVATPVNQIGSYVTTSPGL